MPVEMLVPIIIFFGLAVGLGLVITGEAMKNIDR
jgi:hypothetical protein